MCWGDFVWLVFPGNLLQRPLVGFGDEECAKKSESINDAQTYQRVPKSNAFGVPRIHLRFVCAFRGIKEPKRPDNCAGFPGGGRNAVTSRPEPGREELGGHDECRAIGPKVGEEEGERVEDDEPILVVFA